MSATGFLPYTVKPILCPPARVRGLLLALLLPVGLLAQPTPANLVAHYRQVHGLPATGPLPALHASGTSYRGWRTMAFRRWHGPTGAYRSEVDMGGSSTFTLVAEGDKGWEINPYSPLEGPRALDAGDVALLADERHAWPAFLTVPSTSLEIVQSDRSSGRTRYVLLVRHKGRTSTFVLDSATAQVESAQVWLRSTQGQALQVEYVPSDFRQVGSLRLPYRLTYSLNGQTIKRDSVHTYQLSGPTAEQLRYPDIPNRPKTFGFRADHPAERWLLSDKLPAPKATPRLAQRDGRQLRPVTVTYTGVHKGLHPDWVYQTSWELTEGVTPQGRRVWRLRQNITSSARDEASGTLLDYSSLVPVQDVVGYQSGEITYQFAPDSVHMTLRRRMNNSPQVAATPTERRSLRFSPDQLTQNMLDAVLASLPLKPGYRVQYTLLYEFTPRPFVAQVSGTETVSVGGQQVPCYIVELLPQDGDRHAHTVLYLRQQAPHIPLRRRYVVHPVTVDANTPKSMGNEDATAIRTGT